MKKTTFFDGVLVALVTSLVGSASYYVLSSLFADNLVIRFLISGITLAYILYLLNRSNEKTGRITVISAWSVITIIIWLVWPPAPLFILINLASLWLIRSLYFYSSLFSSLADLALTAISIVVAFWVASHTDSLFLSLWCFFLTQALFVLILSSMKNSRRNTDTATNNSDFQHAYQVAEAAVQKLSTHQ
ncbi:hypothetical protein A9Q78_02760 [Methylophaga sp. 41_12_T18]|nr:hypothetical protein A9Q78_02760 [Methylophaga sp. 41_12_T18]